MSSTSLPLSFGIELCIVEVCILEFLDTELSFQVQVLCTGSNGAAEPNTKVQDRASAFGHDICAFTMVFSFPELGLAR